MAPVSWRAAEATAAAASLLLVHVAAGWGSRRRSRRCRWRRRQEVQVEEQEEEEQERGEDLAPGCSTARPPPQVPTFATTTEGARSPKGPSITTKTIFTSADQDLSCFQGHPI